MKQPIGLCQHRHMSVRVASPVHAYIRTITHARIHTAPAITTTTYPPPMPNLSPINQKHKFALTRKISFGPHMTREPISFPVKKKKKNPSNAAKLPDSAACRNQIQSEITANHLSQ